MFNRINNGLETTDGIRSKNNIPNHSFYNEKSLILFKYVTLETPPHVIQFYKNKYSYEQNVYYTGRGEMPRNFSFIDDSIYHFQSFENNRFHIPLMTYWTKFEDLDENQLAWYLCWRNCILRNQYPDTDLSYIILFAYELLNYSFNRNAAFNASMLYRLIEGYKEREYRVERYITSWLNDFLFECNRPDLVTESNMDYHYIPPLYEKIHSNQIWSSISFTAWKPYIIRYDNETEFFLKNRNKIYNIFKSSIHLLRNEYELQHRHIIDEWFEIKHESSEQNLFSSAVIERPVSKRICSTIQYIATDQLHNDVTQFLKLSEKIAQFLYDSSFDDRMVPKEIDNFLPEGLEEKIIHFLVSQKQGKREKERFKIVQESISQKGSLIPPQNISDNEELKQSSKELQFDFQRIKSLQQESDQMLHVFENYYEAIEEAIEENINTDIQPNNENEVNDNLETRIVKPLDDSPLTTISDYTENELFLNSLNIIEKNFLQQFKSDQIKIYEANLYLKEKGHMLTTIVDSLNQKALDHLEDIFLEEENEYYKVCEEHIKIFNQIKEEQY